MAGRVYFAVAGGSDLAAIWYSACGPHAKLDELERAHGTARLIWSMPGSPKDEAAVHATIGERRVGDQNLFKLTADQVADLIEGIKGRVRRETQELQAVCWVTRVAAAAAEELKQLEREENELVDTRTLEQTDEEERCAEEATNDAAMDAGEDLEMDLEAEIEALEAAGGNVREYAEWFRSGFKEEDSARFGTDHGRPGGDAQAVDPADLVQIIDGIRARGITSFNGIANELNVQNIPGARHGRWYATTVRKLLARGKRNS
jgi:hypothetical protein